MQGNLPGQDDGVVVHGTQQVMRQGQLDRSGGILRGEWPIGVGQPAGGAPGEPFDDRDDGGASSCQTFGDVVNDRGAAWRQSGGERPQQACRGSHHVHSVVILEQQEDVSEVVKRRIDVSRGGQKSRARPWRRGWPVWPISGVTAFPRFPLLPTPRAGVGRACHDDVATRHVAQRSGSGEYAQLPGIEGLDSCPCRCRRRGALGEVGQGPWRRVGEIGAQGEQLGELLGGQAPQFPGNSDG